MHQNKIRHLFAVPLSMFQLLNRLRAPFLFEGKQVAKKWSCSYSTVRPLPLQQQTVFSDKAESKQKQLHRYASENVEEYWRQAAKDVTWIKPPTQILDSSRAPFYKWYPDGELNTCYNCVDHHVNQGRGEQIAVIYDSAITGVNQTVTYLQLQEKVARMAGVLRSLDVVKGDRVVIYMPMIIESLVAMLACARIGAVHSVVFGGFASKELAKRIEDSTPKVVLSASCGLEPSRVVPYKPLLDEAIKLSSHKPVSTVIFQRPQLQASLNSIDHDWVDANQKAKPAECVPVLSTDPLYILFTSGTTGRPKGILRDNGGHAVALKHSMRLIYNAKQGDVFWAASDLGWVVGHSYTCYAPLLQGCTTVLFEGKPVGTPDAGTFWRVCEQHKVNQMFTAPTAVRSIKREDPQGKLAQKYNLSHLQALFLAGERCDPDTLIWSQNILQRPVIDHWWMTETGTPITGLCRGLESQEARPGSCGQIVPGWNVLLLDQNGKEIATPLAPSYSQTTQAAAAAQSKLNEHLEDYEIESHHANAVASGAVAIRLPLPPGAMPTLWANDEGFIKSYLTKYAGYFDTGDAGVVDKDGFLSIMSRADDIIQVAGHRLSTGSLEEVLSSLPEVAECAVVGARDNLKGMKPVGMIVLKNGVSRPHESIVQDAIALIRKSIGAFACFERCYVVLRVPKTRSGKVLRRVLRSIVNGEIYEIPSTIDDPAILDEIKQVLEASTNIKAKL